MIKISGKQIEAVVFDFDGTLYENGFFLKFIFLIYNILHFKIFFSHRKVIAGLRGNDFGTPELYSTRVFSEMAKRTGKSLETIQNWYYKIFKRTFCSILKKYCKPRKKFNDLCHFLKENQVKTAIFSDYGFIGSRLEALNIELDCFDLLVSGETEGVLKPGPRPLLKIAKHFGIAPEKVLVVGDRADTDGLAAANAGMNYYIIKKKSGKDNSVSWNKLLKILMNNKTDKETA
ncbi:MAG TPA: HAD family hydrolase [bacterium]|mgnify:CR=1 FL=1|nr:HAD family hydrolase [bacterium]HPS29283.1 HAD family hydrolase [bacterium]